MKSNPKQEMKQTRLHCIWQLARAMWSEQIQPRPPANFNCFLSFTSVVKELVRHDKKAKLDLIWDEDDDSNTALHLACINGHYNVAKVLLEADTDPNVRYVSC